MRNRVNILMENIEKLYIYPWKKYNLGINLEEVRCEDEEELKKIFTYEGN